MIMNVVMKTLAVAVLAASGVAALPQAVCGAHGSYLKTSTGHNPCDLASYLVGGGVKPVDSPFPNLEDLNRTSYPVPTAAQANDLQCNQVFYTLVSACAACQSSTMTWATWDQWSASCKSFSGVSRVAQALPNEVPIPNWAFTSPRATNGTFDANYAFVEAESTIPDSYFPNLVVKESTICSSSVLGSGGIAGVVIGSIAALALIVLAAVFFKRRTNSSKNTHLVRTGSHGSSVDGIMRQKTEA